MYSDLSDYVYFEAKEKAFEIEIEARKKFERKKDEILKNKVKKIEEEFDRKLEQKETDYKIAHSKLINKSRGVKLIARNKAIMKLLNRTQLEMLQKITENKEFYKDLLKNLIVEGLISMMEEKIKIRCLERDVEIVKSVIDDAVALYKENIKKQLGEEKELELEVDENRCMIERKIEDLTNVEMKDMNDEYEDMIKVNKHEDDKKCFGGVVLSTADNRIILKNTLDIRIETIFEDCLPEIRHILFENE